MTESKRLYFRVLRTDEDVHNISPKQKNPRKDKPIDQMVKEHIRYGSKPDYKSSLISMTAELYVALAWGGIVSRIVYTNLAEKQQGDYITHLDKNYLRDFLTGTDVKNRSKRSDEVLVFGQITSAKLLKIEITNVKRTLTPGFEGGDSGYFPEQDIGLFNNLKTMKSIAGANKRLFEVNINNKLWVAVLPRPNYSLDDPVYMNSDLVDVCKHHFKCFSAYRYLTEHIPRCAMYTFEFHYNTNDDPRLKLLPENVTYQWAFILLEPLNLLIDETHQEGIIHASRKSFMADVLLGNWNCLDGQTLRSVVDPAHAVFARTKSNDKIVKLAVDRSLGCIYPEDEHKVDKMKIPFLDNCDILMSKLQEKYQWCYGVIDKKDIMQQIMDLTVEEKDKKGADSNNLYFLRDCISSAEWPPWVLRGQQQYSLLDIFNKRIESLFTKIPFYVIRSPTEKPSARDGHGAVTVGNMMYVAGGNSSDGALKDFWRFNYDTNEWKELQAFPAEFNARFSFSMHVYLNKYIIIFGGCPGLGRNKNAPILNDLMFYDIEKGYWDGLKPDQGSKWPDRRCRQGSYLITDYYDDQANLYIFGGHNGRKKLNDVWKGTIVFTDARLVCNWQQMKNLERSTHRCATFAVSDSVLLVGGFGRSLMKIQEVDLTDSEQPKTVTTHDLLNLPSSDKEALIYESKSLAGFGAVYDEVGKRLILVGGGNIDKNGSPKEKSCSNQSFGSNAKATVNIKPRILYLNHGIDQNGRDEWKWQINDAYELLDSKHKLPCLSTWSACYIEKDHSVLLFGGRNGEDFSNDLYKLQLRPEYVVALDEIKSKAIALNNAVCDVSEQWKEQEKFTFDMARHHLGTLVSIPDKSNLVNDFHAHPFRMLTLNVHGFKSEKNKEFIDGHISELLEICQPDLACFQEVKHPFPSNTGECLIQLDHSTFLRFSLNSSVSDVMRLLSWDTDEKKLIFKTELEKIVAKLKDVEGLPHRIPKLMNCGASVHKEQPSVLEKLASNLKKFNFSPALDMTFGNAIVSLKADCVFNDTVPLNITGVEKRCASIATVIHSRNWTFSIVNVHLDVNDEAIRIQQMNKLLHHLCLKDAYGQSQDLTAMPHILCGDFNAYSHWRQCTTEYCKKQGYDPSDKLYKLLTEDLGYIDLETNRPPRDTSCWGVRVDYVFVSWSLAARLLSHKLYVLPTESDHKGVLACIKFNKKVLVGVTGLMSPDKELRHLKQQVGNQRIIEMQRCDAERLTGESAKAYNLSSCYNEAVKALHESDVVVVCGQHLNFLLPCLDMLFVLESKESICYRLFKKRYHSKVDNTMPQDYWKKHVMPSWRQQYDGYNVELQKGSMKKIHKINIGVVDIGRHIVDAIASYNAID